MKPIRVLQIFTVLNRGGAESMIMNYYRVLDRSKIQFDFLVHRKEKGVFEDEIESLGGKIHRLKKINPLFPNRYYDEFRNFLNKNKQYQIIHSHLNTFSAYPLKIAKECNIPCRIAHAHIALEPFDLNFIFNKNEPTIEKIKHIIKLRLKNNISKYSTHSFSCGKKAGKWLFGNKPFLTMNNAIHSEKFRYNPEVSKEYKKKLKIKSEIILGHIGRFDSQKNHSFLLKIFAALLKVKPESKLLLIGDGPSKLKIKEEAKRMSILENIHFLGVRKDVEKLVQVMDAFVFPSLYEGLPVTLIEAQAAGLNIIASDTITDEVVITKLVEFISLNNTPEFWAKEIIKIISKKNEKKDTKELIVEKGYDIFSNVIKIEKFYLQQNTKAYG